MSATLTSALLAFGGYSLLNLSQAGQKIGLELRNRAPFAGWGLWVATTAATSVAFAIVFAAVAIGDVSVVGAMSGTGLAALAVFGRFAMKEHFRPQHVVALVAIIGGATLVALFRREFTPTLNVSALWLFLAAGTAGYGVSFLLLRRGRLIGVVIGGLSGFLGAYSQLFQELGSGGIVAGSTAAQIVATLATDPITLVWGGLSVASMVVIQFAYKHGEATRIIPVFTANFIIVPVVGGIVAFGERLTVVQGIGVALILAGSVVLGGKREPARHASDAAGEEKLPA